MTGNEIEKIRSALDMSVPNFAGLLGVHVTTIYRWSAAAEKSVTVDPLHAALLAKIQQGIADRQKNEREDWGKEILKALLIGGTLAALAIVLVELMPKARRR